MLPWISILNPRDVPRLAVAAFSPVLPIGAKLSGIPLLQGAVPLPPPGEGEVSPNPFPPGEGEGGDGGEIRGLPPT